MKREWYNEWIESIIKPMETDMLLSILPLFLHSNQNILQLLINGILPSEIRRKQTFANNQIDTLNNDNYKKLINNNNGYKITPQTLTNNIIPTYKKHGNKILQYQANKYNFTNKYNLTTNTATKLATDFVAKQYPQIEQTQLNNLDNIQSRISNGFKSQKEENDYINKLSQNQSKKFVIIASNNVANKLLIIQMKTTYPTYRIRKGWISRKDNRVRQTHRIADKQYKAKKNLINIDDNFTVGGESLPYPTGGSKPENNINCRCVIGFLFNEKENQIPT